MKTPWRGWRPRAGCWSTRSGRPPPSWRPWRTTRGRPRSTRRSASAWPTAASITRPNEPSCWPPPPTPPAPMPPIGLGMLYMQVGRETEAKSLFDAAFAADPFNVRADNMIKVLRHMATYDPHRFQALQRPGRPDPGRIARPLHVAIPGIDLPDPDLAIRLCAARPDQDRDPQEPPVVQRPDDRPAVRAHGRGVHGAGRGPGQPAGRPGSRSTGRGCSLTSSSTSSPCSRPSSISRTGTPRPWPSRAKASRGPRSGTGCSSSACPSRKLLNLDTINLGFIRPKEPDDRQMAYCQAQLYARYMLKRFGDDALIKMLMAYRRGLTTDRAIADCFHVEKADFEKGYLAYLDEVLKTIRTRVERGEADQVLAARASAQGEARRSRPERADGLRAFRPPQLLRGAAVRRQGARAEAAPSAGQLRQGPAPAVDRRRARGHHRRPRAGARPEAAQRARDRPPGRAEDEGRRARRGREALRAGPEGRPVSHQVDRGAGAGPPPPEADGRSS